MVARFYVPDAESKRTLLENGKHFSDVIHPHTIPVVMRISLLIKTSQPDQSSLKQYARRR